MSGTFARSSGKFLISLFASRKKPSAVAGASITRTLAGFSPAPRNECTDKIACRKYLFLIVDREPDIAVENIICRDQYQLLPIGVDLAILPFYL
jgi:hypothetical protein